MSFIQKIVPYFLLLFSLWGCSSSAQKQQKEVEKREATITKTIEQANQLLATKQHEEVLQLLETLSQKYPNDPNILEALGFVHVEEGDSALAAFYFEQTARIDPSRSRLYLYAAEAYLKSEESASAIKAYEEYLIASPEDRSAKKTLSRLHMKLKHPKLAVETYQSALDGANVSGEECVEMGGFFEEWNKLSEAKKWYQWALEKKDSAVEKALLGLLSIEMKIRKNWKEIEGLLNRLKTGFPQNIEKNDLFIRAEKAVRQWHEKQEAIIRKKEEAALIKEQEKVKEEKTPCDCFLAVAKEASENADYKTAIQHYWKALALSPQAAFIWRDLSKICLCAKEYKCAEMTALEAMRCEPDNVEWVLHYLDIASHTQSSSQFIEELQRAKAQFPESPEIASFVNEQLEALR